MRFLQFKPAAPLDAFVECFWYLETRDEAGPVQRIVPDGSVELIFHAGAPFAQIRNGEPHEQNRILISGQITKPVFIAPSAGARVFGIRFRPDGAAAVLPIPLSELTEQLLPLDAVSGELHLLLSNALDDSEPATVLRRIASALASRLSDAKPSTPVGYIVRCIRNSHGNIPISQIADECGISERQLQRMFRQHVGISPKLLSRISRFQRVLTQLDSTASNWADVAVDAGYYDQSHLLLDFRQFAAETPSFLLSPHTDLAEHFTWRHSVSHFSKTARA
jgi:AraC-like DNA-binding protein